MSLFPMFTAGQSETAAGLPVYQDVKMDYGSGTPVWSGGSPVMVSGLEAVKGWAWRCIMTARYRYPSFSWSYGCELEALVGHPYTADTKLAEARRYVEEALLVSPYIREVQVTDSWFEGDTLHLDVRIATVYGEVDMRV